MIASCPSCATRFAVTDAKLGPQGRKVKCGKCGHVWVQLADGTTRDVPPRPSLVESAAPPVEDKKPAEAAAPAPAAEQAPAAADPAADAPAPAATPEATRSRRAAMLSPAPKRRSGKQVVAALLALVVVLGLLGLGVAAWRSGELARNPMLASLFGPAEKREALPEGLGFENVTTERRAESGGQVLIVAGEVVNNATVVRAIPPLRGTLLTSDSREVQNWTFTASAERVEPGKRVRFETTLRGPSTEATEVKVTFAAPGG